MRLLSRLPVHPVLIAAYAVLFVYAANIGEVLPGDLGWPLTVALGGAAVALAAFALLYRDLRRGALLASAIVVAVAFFGHGSSLIDEEVVDVTVQLGVLAVAVIAVAVYAARAKGSLPTATAALNAFALVLLAMSLATILPYETSRDVRASNGDVADEGLPESTTAPDRDIYFLVFDRYGSDWSHEASFGIENDIYPYLEEAGFEVVPGGRANYHRTDFSLAATLNMRYHDGLAAAMVEPSTDRGPVRKQLANNTVGKFMRANGYRYYHVGAWWEPTRRSPIADEVLALGETTEFEAVLRAATILPALEEVAGTTVADTDSRDQHREQALFAFRQVQRLADNPERTFTFAHILLPHPPYVLAEGGRVVYEEEAKAKSEAELLEQQLRFTNEMIRQTVETLLAGPDDEDPIIILTGDEGPYLCYEVDCVDGSARAYGIRLGVLRAYYLPDIDVEIPPDDSGVNIFRMILREYFGADLPDLPNRSYAWPDDDDIYEFRDITDLLPLPGGEAAGG